MSKKKLSARIAAAALLPWIGRLATVGMLGVLAWLGAQIFWTLNAPAGASPSTRMETDLQRAPQSIVKRHLFGQYIAAAGVSAAPSNLRLNGVIAGQKAGQRAYALITVEGKAAQLVREGEDIAPGITLQRVRARQVEIQRGGQSQTLNLPESGKAQAEGSKTLNAGTPPVPGPADAPAVNVPPVSQSPSAPPVPRRGRTRRSSEDDS